MITKILYSYWVYNTSFNSFAGNISTICVHHYVQSLSVTFIAFINCGGASEKSYGVIQYTWNFGNGKNVTTYIPSASITYQSMGTYNFSVLVSNNVSESNYTEEINITTGTVNIINSLILTLDLLCMCMQSSHRIFIETDTTSVQLDISGPRFAHVNSSVNFSVISNVSVTN